ncbi:MAG: OmpP1/FadL family transporter [Bacteroidota bacterium]
MKKILLTLIAICLVTGLMGGGLVTNTNQSASYTRMMCRDATVGVDAVYFNPAGLTKLGNGLHLSISNQTIGQTKTITSNFPFLGGEKPVEYTGEVSAPLFPSVYAAFKLGKFVISAGFNPIGGGGGAEYLGGLPSFEMPVSTLVPSLQSQLLELDAGVQLAGYPDPMFRNVQAYAADITFTGSSVYYGTQVNFSYEVNKMISVALGARYVMAKNTYQGSVSNVTITASPDATTGIPAPYTDSPGNYLRTIASHPYAAAAGAADELNMTAAYLDAATNLEADVEQSGSGITPIVSVNISPIDMLNIAVKYEHKTKLELETTVIDGKDAGGMYVDGSKVVADMPAMLSVGASLNPMDKILVSAGVHYFFDKNNDYDGNPNQDVEMIDKNFIEYALGVEYKLFGPLSVSAGYLGTQTGVNDNYQSDIRYSLNTNTFGGGVKLSLTPLIDINLGASMTMYDEGSKTYSYLLGEIPVPVTETYDTSTWVVAVGVDLNF